MKIDERIKLIAVVIAAVATVGYGIAWSLNPEASYNLSTSGSVVALIVFAALWRIERAPAVLIVFATIAITIAVSAGRAGAGVRTGSGLAIVTIGMIGVVLVENRRLLYVAALSLVTLAYPFVIFDDQETRLSLAVTSTVSFVLGALVLITVFRETERLREERTQLFELAPIHIVDADWTEAEQRVRALGISDPGELRRYLLERPEWVGELLATVEVLAANRSARTDFAPPGANTWRMSELRVHETSLAAFVEQLVALVTDTQVHRYEYETTRTDGTRVVISLNAVTIRTRPDQTRVLLAAQDVTERRDTQIALQRALKEKDTLIATVSHELRTPLSAVVGLSASLLESDELTPEAQELLELIANQSTEMSQIIEDLLVSARADRLELSVDLAPVDGKTEVLAAVAGRDVAVRSVDGIFVLADPIRLRQVIRNLVTNAERYGRPPIAVEVEADNGVVRFEVSDSGPPIPAEDRDRIFEPYETAHGNSPVAGSVGLGLALCRTLARRMSGDITYRHDGRSVFSLQLPRHIEREAE